MHPQDHTASLGYPCNPGVINIDGLFMQIVTISTLPSNQTHTTSFLLQVADPDFVLVDACGLDMRICG